MTDCFNFCLFFKVLYYSTFIFLIVCFLSLLAAHLKLIDMASFLDKFRVLLLYLIKFFGESYHGGPEL